MIINIKKPIIGITKPAKRRLNPTYWALCLSVWLAGGRIKIISFRKTIDINKLDGLLLGGGSDIFPGIFKKDPKKNYRYDRKRDEMEIELLKTANQINIPVFAICRGSQLMNVVSGGSLHMDISKVFFGTKYPDDVLGYLFFRKKIFIESDSIMFDIFRKNQLMVNSLHKQSIDQVGEGLEITAKEKNGIIQAIENKNKPFYLGVQFHPELLIYKKMFRRIFKTFVVESQNYKRHYKQ